MWTIPPSRRETRGAWRRGPFAWRAVFITFMLVWCAAAQAQKLQDEVRYEARDSIRYDLANQTVYLFGAATVHYQDIQLSADRITFNFKNEEAQAFGALVADTLQQAQGDSVVTGKPQFTQGGHTIDADSIRYNFTTKQGLIREVRTQESEAWVHASLSKRHANGEVHSKGGMLTTCDRPYPHYHFKVGRMMVIPDNKIITGPAYMKVGKVPMPLAVPFGLFPNHKGSTAGVLIPVWGNNQELGYFLLNGGWYQPFGDHVDQQLTGDIYSRGSWALKSVTRYKSRYHYNGVLELNHSTLLNSDPEYPDFSRQRNYFINWRHQMDPKASLTDRFSAQVNVGTSSNYTNNFNSSANQYLSNTFQSNIGYTHLWPGKPYTFSANALHRQNTNDRSFSITLPALTFNIQRVLPIQLLRPPAAAPRWYDQLAVSYTAKFDNQLTTTEDQIYLGNVANLAAQARNGVRQTAALTTTLKNRFFSFNPEFNVVNRMYFEQLRLTAISADDTTYTVADTIPQFAAPFEWNARATLTGKLYGTYFYFGEKLKAIRHTVTPSVGLTYLPDNSTRITGPYGTDGATTTYSPYQIGIYGEPNATRSGSLNFGLIQNVEAKVRDKKAMLAQRDTLRQAQGDDLQEAQEGDITYKKIKLIDYISINASRDLLKDSLQWSNIGMSTRTTFLNILNVNLNSVWDPYAVDGEGQRINRSERSVSGALARMVHTTVAAGFEFKSKRYGQPVASNTNDQQVVNESDPTKGGEVNFSMPWRLGVNYSYDVGRSYTAPDTYTDTEAQSILFNGDVTVLKYWKLGVSSGYDMVAQDWTYTTLNLYWDLHCWEFNFNIIPLGERKSFMFRINVKASILRDLKYEQRKPYGGGGDLLY